jgi:hypothetical protein
MNTPMENPLLQAAEEKLEAGLTPENRLDYTKIVVGGLKTALFRGPNGLYRAPNGGLASLKNSKDPIAQCVTGAVNLVMLMRVHTNNAMPVKALIPAGMTLMLKGLDFAERIGVVKIGNDELVRATHLFTNLIFQKFGITARMLHTAAARVHAITRDPAAMGKINIQAGITKHPNAAPVPAPGGGQNVPD